MEERSLWELAAVLFNFGILENWKVRRRFFNGTNRLPPNMSRLRFRVSRLMNLDNFWLLRVIKLEFGVSRLQVLFLHVGFDLDFDAFSESCLESFEKFLGD